MSNYIIGILSLIFSLFIFFVSPKENKNIFGYKSPQQGLNKRVWEWSNKCFGLLTIVGSSLYLIAVVVMKLLNTDKYEVTLNIIGFGYIVFSIIITEIYTFILTHRNKKISS